MEQDPGEQTGGQMMTTEQVTSTAVTKSSRTPWDGWDFSVCPSLGTHTRGSTDRLVGGSVITITSLSSSSWEPGEGVAPLL